MNCSLIKVGSLEITSKPSSQTYSPASFLEAFSLTELNFPSTFCYFNPVSMRKIWICFLVGSIQVDSSAIGITVDVGYVHCRSIPVNAFWFVLHFKIFVCPGQMYSYFNSDMTEITRKTALKITSKNILRFYQIIVEVYTLNTSHHLQPLLKRGSNNDHGNPLKTTWSLSFCIIRIYKTYLSVKDMEVCRKLWLLAHCSI